MPVRYLTLSAPHETLTHAAIADIGLTPRDAQWLTPQTAAIFTLQSDHEKVVLPHLNDAPFDWCMTNEHPKPKALFLADMDSTMIEIECIDELADYAGVKAEVSEITEKAMRGDLDFRQALAARVALLEGLSTSVLEDCYRERVRFSDGAKAAVQTMARNGCRCVLVSGGFTFFTHRVAEALGFHRHRANELGTYKGVLTGKVIPPISDAATKVETLQSEQNALHIGASDIIAVGDGANDIPMIEAAGLGIAYRAKPKTRAAARASIDHSDLSALLHFQGLAT
ncbi:MAG: phosphoserine phosphatase SerB [Pseudomonadota bacterium]